MWTSLRFSPYLVSPILTYSICFGYDSYMTASLYVPGNNSFEKNTDRIKAACSKIWFTNTQGIQIQFDHLFIPQKKGRHILETKSQMRHMAFISLFWQSLFTFSQHMFTSICRGFSARTLPMQFQNSFCYTGVLKQILTGIFEKCIFTTFPHSQKLISFLSLHKQLHNSSQFVTWMWQKLISSHIKWSWKLQSKLNIQSFFKHLSRQ